MHILHRLFLEGVQSPEKLITDKPFCASWGDGFLDTLSYGSIGTNYGHSGANTVSFVAGGDWGSVIDSVTGSAEEYDTYVTIQVRLAPNLSSRLLVEISLTGTSFMRIIVRT